MPRLAVVFVVLLWAALPVQAEPDGVEASADRVVRAATTGDTLALRLIAQAEDPDPWLVAHALIERGELAAARRLASATERVDVATLAAYVEALKDWRPDEDRRSALDKAARELEGGHVHEALAGLRDIVRTRDDVPGVVARFAAGLAHERLGDHAEATEAFGGAATLAASLGWLAMTERAHRHATAAALDDGDIEQALVHAVAWRDVAVRRDRSGAAAAAALEVGSVHMRDGSLTEAASAFGDALDRFHSLGDLGSAALAHSRLGDVQLALGNLLAAEAEHARALADAETTGQSDVKARASFGLGVVRARLGDYAKARRAFETTAKVAAETGNAALRADALANLGLVKLCEGDLAGALLLHEDALSGREEESTPAHATTLQNLGLLYASLGQPERALACLEQARSIHAGLGNRPGVSAALSNIGVVKAAVGALPDALDCQTQALAMERAMGNVAGEARVLARMGHVHELRGEFPEALELTNRSLVLRRQLKDALGEAIALETLAHLHTQLGSYAEAQARRRESLYLAKKLGARDVEARNQWGLAELHLSCADPAAALEAAKACVEAVPTFARGLFDEQGVCARERWASAHDVGMTAAAMLGDVTSFAWFLERQRATTLLESLGGRDAILAATVPEALREADAAARARETYAIQALQDAIGLGARKAIKIAKDELEVARAEVTHQRERIAQSARSAAEVVQPKTLTLRAMRQRARTGEAIVLYAVLPDETFALVLTTRGQRLVSLGPSSAIEELCAGLELYRGGKTPTGAIDRLRELVVDPLALDGKVKRVLVSPDGVLCSVPFSLLVEGLDLAHIPSVTTYAFLRSEAKGAKGEGVLALGRPEYGPRSVGPSAERGGGTIERHPGGLLSPLEGSFDEVHAIGDFVLTDSEATEDGLKAAILMRDRWRAVHLACHGLVDLDRPLFSSLALTPNAYGDGLLQAVEIFGLEVPADLVVLSACDTGKGRLYRTEGIFGFTRAFLFAGASRVMVSLWKVDDEATRALMTKFYELWNPARGKSIDAATALRLAQEHVRSHDEWRDPYYWAAWQLWGLPR